MEEIFILSQVNALFIDGKLILFNNIFFSSLAEMGRVFSLVLFSKYHRIWFFSNIVLSTESCTQDSGQGGVITIGQESWRRANMTKMEDLNKFYAIAIK